MKYKVWDKELEEIVTDYPICINVLTGKIVEFRYGEYWDEHDVKDTEYILNDFTGFRDKNDVEIYENDIVKVFYQEHWYISYIRYEFGELTVASKYIGKDFHYFENPLDVIFDNIEGGHAIEVIGNMYENKDILEQQ